MKKHCFVLSANMQPSVFNSLSKWA